MPEETLFNDLGSSDDGPVDTASNGDGPIAQSFNSGSASVKLDDLKLVLKQDTFSGFPATGTITIQLFSNNADKPGSAIATLGTIEDATLTSSSATYDFALSNGPTLTANTTYWIELSEGPSANGAWELTNDPTGTGVAGQSDYMDSVTNSFTAMLMSLTGNTCFAAGTRILTARGEVEVGALRPGDHAVALRGARLAPVRWVGRRHVDITSHPRPEDVNPIRIHAHAIAEGQPIRDLLVSPDHALYLDGGLIAARYLLNGATIVQEAWPRITYYHVELDTHDVLLADALPAESFLDVGNRGNFANGGGVTTLHPAFSPGQAAAIWETRSCAPSLDQGEALTALRRRLLDRAMTLGHSQTNDPDLAVIAGGRALRATRNGNVFRFDLPPNAGLIRLISRRFSPKQMRAENADGRMLGIGVRAIALDDNTLALDDPRLESGWHAPERVLRWTDGDATIDAYTARTLTLCLHGDVSYWDDRVIEQSRRAIA